MILSVHRGGGVRSSCRGGGGQVQPGGWVRSSQGGWGWVRSSWGGHPQRGSGSAAGGRVRSSCWGGGSGPAAGGGSDPAGGVGQVQPGGGSGPAAGGGGQVQLGGRIRSSQGGWVRSSRGGGSGPAGGGSGPAGGGGSAKIEQHREYLLHGGQYASCVHAGGLSCLCDKFGKF